MTVPPGVTVHEPDASRGEVAVWTSGVALLSGYLRVAICEPVVLRSVEWPACVKMSAGFRWTTPDQLLAAARVLEAAAHELDALSVGDQLDLFQEAGCS